MIRLILTTSLLAAFGFATPPSLSAQEANSTPETIDLRVDGDPLLLLFERIARELRLGLIANSEVVEVLRKEVSIDIAEVRWRDAVEYFENEFGISMLRDNKRLILSNTEAEFGRQLEHRTYSVGQLISPEKKPGSPYLGYNARHWGFKGLLDAESGRDPILIEDLEEIIPAVAGRGTWDRDGVELTLAGRFIHVHQTPAVHEEIEAWITATEKRVARQVICRVYSITPGDHAQLLSSEELKEAAGGQDPIASWVANDGAMSFWFSGQEHDYISDVEFVNHVPDPLVETLRSGWVIDLEPHVTEGGVWTNFGVSWVHMGAMSSSEILGDDGVARAVIQTPKLEFQVSSGSQLVPSGSASVHRFGTKVLAIQVEVLTSE